MEGKKKIQVHFYALKSGREPVREFLLSLDKEERKKVGEDIKACEIGWPLGSRSAGSSGTASTRCGQG